MKIQKIGLINMDDKDTKPLILSGSFWSILAASVWGINWTEFIPQLGDVISDIAPPEYQPVVKAVVALLIAILGILRVKGREKKIKGIILSPPKPKLPR